MMAFRHLQDPPKAGKPAKGCQWMLNLKSIGKIRRNAFGQTMLGVGQLPLEYGGGMLMGMWGG